MNPYIYLPLWFVKTKFLGQKNPLQTVLFINNECNLECRHCCVYSKDHIITKSLVQIKAELEHSFKKGSRFVDFEGGEPFLWKENDKNINDLVLLAKEIGFFSTTITTNAQLPIMDSKADSIWISLDGIGSFHNAIRGEGAFEKLEQNIANSNHKNLHTNMVVNNLNYTNVEETILWVKNNPNLKSIAINFHTPFPGTEELSLNQDLRNKILDQVISLKKRGFPIMNSVSGLKYMKKEISNRYCHLTNFIHPDGTKRDECEGKILGLCEKCGFCMSGEMRAVMNLKPDTLFAGLKLRV
ncbi:MAG TPA: radical SAM protein [Bacteroidales bacterium]|nr:radical SAM protein [Bacteroidales bacterium]